MKKVARGMKGGYKKPKKQEETPKPPVKFKGRTKKA